MLQEQFIEALRMIVATARQQPNGRMDIRDENGVAVAYVQTVEADKRRPKDMPRAERPKLKLSKRERVAAKREKLNAAA
jgi:hypothetical protein